MNLKREIMKRFTMWLLFAIPLVCLSLLLLYYTQGETFRPALILILQVFILSAFAALNVIYFFFRMKEVRPAVAKLPPICFVGAAIIYLEILPKLFGYLLGPSEILLFFFFSSLSLTLMNMIVILSVKD